MSFFLTVWQTLSPVLPLSLRPSTILEARQRSGQWRHLREEHLKKQPQCAACGRTRNLIVHHIVPVSFDPTLELDPDNLLTLCETPCHIVFGHFFSYHCYNRDVRRTTADFYRALAFYRKCLPPQFKQ